MKTLEKGRDQIGWSIEEICSGRGHGSGGCGAKLLVEQPDLFKATYRTFEETENAVSFRCSECGVLTALKEQVPLHVYQELPYRHVWVKDHPWGMTPELAKRLKENLDSLKGFPMGAPIVAEATRIVYQFLRSHNLKREIIVDGKDPNILQITLLDPEDKP